MLKVLSRSVSLLLQIWMVEVVGMLALVPRRMDLIFTELESLRSRAHITDNILDSIVSKP